MIERLKTLQAKKGQFTSFSELTKSLKTNDALRSNNSLRKDVEELARVFLKRNISGCSSCYMDAYIELINLNIQKVMTKTECQFTLPAGQLLRDKTGNTKYLCSQFNITDELALYHLKTNPSCVKLFAQLPEGWEKMVEEFELTEEESKVDLERKEDIEGQLKQANGIIENQKTEIGKLEGELKEKTDRITELEEDNEELQTKVDDQTKEILGFTSQLVEVKRALQIAQALNEDDVEKFTAALTHDELLAFIEQEELKIKGTETMLIDALRIAVVAECERLDAIVDIQEETSESAKEPVQEVADSEEQKLAEDTLVLQIAERIKAGETKTSIKDSLKDGKVGEKNLTQRFINELVARADELNK